MDCTRGAGVLPITSESNCAGWFLSTDFLKFPRCNGSSAASPNGTTSGLVFPSLPQSGRSVVLERKISVKRLTSSLHTNREFSDIKSQTNKYLECQFSGCEIREIYHITIGSKFQYFWAKLQNKKGAWCVCCKYDLYKVGKVEIECDEITTVPLHLRKNLISPQPDSDCYIMR